MILKCQKCGHEWIYKGKSQFLTSCPLCKSLVKTQATKEPDRGPPTDL
jgi:ribosomal protein S27E